MQENKSKRLSLNARLIALSEMELDALNAIGNCLKSKEYSFLKKEADKLIFVEEEKLKTKDELKFLDAMENA